MPRKEIAQNGGLVILTLLVIDVGHVEAGSVEILLGGVPIHQRQRLLQHLQRAGQVLTAVGRQFLDLRGRLLVALGCREPLVVPLDLLEQIVSQPKGGVEVLGINRRPLQLHLQLSHLEQRHVLVFAGPPLDESTVGQRRGQQLVAVLLDRRPLHRQRLLGPNLLPENAQSVGRPALAGRPLAEPFGRLVDHQQEILLLLVIETNQLEQQHLILDPPHRRRSARVPQQFLINPHGLVDVVLLFKALALPHAGIKPQHLAAVSSVNRFELDRRLRGQLDVGLTATVVGLRFLVGAQCQVVLRPHVE